MLYLHRLVYIDFYHKLNTHSLNSLIIFKLMHINK